MAAEEHVQRQDVGGHRGEAQAKQVDNVTSDENNKTDHNKEGFGLNEIIE